MSKWRLRVVDNFAIAKWWSSRIAASALLGCCATSAAAQESTPGFELFAEPPFAEVGDEPELRESQDPVNVVYRAEIRDGEVIEQEAILLGPESDRGSLLVDGEKSRQAAAAMKPNEPRDKVDPLLREMLGEQASGAQSLPSRVQRERVIVVFQEDAALPRFPEPEIGASSTSAINRAAQLRARKLAAQLKNRRAASNAELRQILTDEFDAKVIEEFWLIRALLVEMPLDEIERLAERDDVRSIAPEATRAPPGQQAGDANTDNDVDDGRRVISSDPYFDAGFGTLGRIGLIDTGVRRTHVLFNEPSHLGLLADCVNGTFLCRRFFPFARRLNPDDDCWNHGTQSAGIISGNDRLGDPFLGVTAMRVDSWKVFPSTFDSAGNCIGFLNSAAAVRAFQAALLAFDRVIVTAFDCTFDAMGVLVPGNDQDAISRAADNAFDLGAVVIGIAGNCGSLGQGTITSPGIAHKVISVGAFDVQSGAQLAIQSRGPAPDGRIKPDIQAPTNTETASNGCPFGQDCRGVQNNTALQVYVGTSGASPYAAAAAALARNFLRSNSGTIDPGQTYAFLILSGQQTNFDNTQGTGPIVLPTDGVAFWGKVVIRDGQTIDIPLSIISPNASNLDGALWWPETPTQAHSDIDLRLIAPDGSAASSASTLSVFERARVAGRVVSGTSILRINGFRIPIGQQIVYFAAHVRTGAAAPGA